MKLSALLQRIGYWIVFADIVLLPVFFLPITSEFYEFNKLALLMISTAVLLVIWTVTFVLDKQVHFTRSPFTVPLLAVMASWLLSTYLRTPNRADAMFEPGQMGTMVALCLFFFVSVNLVRTRKDLDNIFHGLIGSFSLLAVTSILWGSGLMEKIIPFNYMQNSIWTPSGNTLGTLAALVSLIPFYAVLVSKEKQNSPRMLVLSLALFLSVIASGLIGFRLFKSGSNFRPVFLSQSASWSIAMESLKVSPLFGTGPSTYLSNFTRFRPVTTNMTPNWAIRFASSSNYYLQLLSTLGIIGVLAYLLLAARTANLFVRTLGSNSESNLKPLALASTVALLLTFASQIFVPISFVTLFLTFALLILAVSALKQMGSSLVHDTNIEIVAASESGHRFPILPWLSLVAILALVLPSVYATTRVYAAEVHFQRALTAAVANDGKKTYDSLIEAMKANPYKDSYRVAYSQTNLLLANSIAANPNITEADRNNVAQLVQQAIQEAKNAVALNPTKVTNVENLASVYQNLLNFAQGADAWTVASYRQAIQLDPVNPNLRIALGGVAYSMKSYDDAITLFQSAVELKPDLANGYYNLSAAYREKGDFANAASAMQQVVNLIDRNSPDLPKAQAELEDLKKRAGQSAATAPAAPAPSELQAPKPLPSPRLNPPLQLPTDLGPESTPSSTLPAVTPAPTTTP